MSMYVAQAKVKPTRYVCWQARISNVCLMETVYGFTALWSWPSVSQLNSQVPGAQLCCTAVSLPTSPFLSVDQHSISASSFVTASQIHHATASWGSEMLLDWPWPAAQAHATGRSTSVSLIVNPRAESIFSAFLTTRTCWKVVSPVKSTAECQTSIVQGIRKVHAVKQIDRSAADVEDVDCWNAAPQLASKDY